MPRSKPSFIQGPTVGHSEELYQVAKQAFGRIKTDDELNGSQYDTLISIIFCVSTLEAFIEELADAGRLSPRGTKFQAFAVEMQKLEADRCQADKKYLEATKVLGMAQP